MESPDLFYFPAGDKPIIDNNNHFTIDDLLDFSKEDEIIPDSFFDNVTHSSTLTLVESCNSSVSGGETQVSAFTDDQFSGSEIYVPYDDLAELEWLSNFVEESFSSDDLQNFDLISATKAPTPAPNRNSSPIFRESVLVPGKARSKRSRAAPCDWSSRLLHLSPVNNKTTPFKETPSRKCLHCGSDKTPQWRTGPMGPKTLCNACGVRFKSGRLVPEYRPASSPTFVSAKHSNSHRKVMELRRQKELHRAHHHQMRTQSSIFDAQYQEYLISGPHFRHMI